VYAYDGLGNLRGARLAAGPHVEYVIDGANRRIGKKLNGRLVQGWVYQDRLKPVAELDGHNAVVSRFVYGTKVNVPEYMEREGRTYRILTDHLGSPRLVVDVETGEIAQRLTYDEFGTVLQDTRPGFQPFGFAGGLYDPHTGLVRFGARDYDPAAGRWTAPDPDGFSGNEPNLYAYASGDPINRVDPAGRQETNILWVEGGLKPPSPYEIRVTGGMPEPPPADTAPTRTVGDLLWDLVGWGDTPTHPAPQPAPSVADPPRRRRSPRSCPPRCGLDCINADTSGVRVEEPFTTATAIRG
jgi:RHS repeat-associated protein